MGKEPAPVCGAKTRAGTSCQNTLVTGCGRCPVHASQLRAAAAGVKPVSRSRRKKKLSRPSASVLAIALTADELMDPPREDPLQDQSLASLTGAVGESLFSVVHDAFGTPLQPSLTATKEELDIVFKKEKVMQSLDSPVTPATDDPPQRFDFMYPELEGGADDSLPSVDVLQDDQDYLTSQLKVNFDELCDSL